MERIILKIIAVQNEFILNPSTNLEHNIIIPPFITNKNKPNVSIVAGNDKITKIGLIKILSNPNTAATITAVVKLSTSTDVIAPAISTTKTAVIKILRISFIIFLFQMYKIIISKTNSSFRKTSWDFRREANDLHLESFQIMHLENAFLCCQNLHREYNSTCLHE